MTLRIALVTVLAFAAIGAGGAVGVMLWEPWGGDEATVSRAFCNGVADWHTAQEPFLLRVDEPGAREDKGLSETQDVFVDAAEVLLPAANSRPEEDVRATLRDTVRTEEEWLSELDAIDDINEAFEGKRSEVVKAELVVAYFDSVKRAEAKRLELNDLLREGNVLLGDACGLEPLPIHH